MNRSEIKLAFFLILAAISLGGLAAVAEEKAAGGSSAVIPDPKQAGGESEGIVQVANLIYAGTKSSK